MKNKFIVVLGLAVFSFGFVLPAKAADKAKPAKSAAELEKEKAMASPWPNDFGPEDISEQIKDYPADKKEGYKLLLSRCAQCHTAARPLHSRFVEPAAGGDAKSPDARNKAQEASVAEMKKTHPEWFKDSSVWQVEAGIWARYVKRMMNKPGCGAKFGGKMTDEEAKKIYQFLQYDGERRKLGGNAEKWAEHRKKLVGDFKENHPERYKHLAEDKDL